MKTNSIKGNIGKSMLGILAIAGVIALSPLTASAHCDTMGGPTVADGMKAMETNNVNYVLKWVQPEYEKELLQAFTLSMQVRNLSPEARELSEKYFFDNLVRIHRTGENTPFTGVKPVGTPVDERVLAADKSIEVGNLSPLKGIIPAERISELTERFEKVMALKNFDPNNLEAGRAYIEAYVGFFKFAEGEEEHHNLSDAHGEANEHHQ